MPGVIASRIVQHLVENLLRKIGEDEARVIRVEHLEAIHHYLIAGYGTTFVQRDRLFIAAQVFATATEQID